MGKKRTTTVVFLAVVFFLSSFILNAYAKPHVEFPPSSEIQASKNDVKELKAFYAKIENAMVRENLDAMMRFYSDDYFHRGITKQQVRLMWKDIFSKFHKLKSVHVFSEITVQDTEALVVCTGTLLGVPAGAVGQKNVAIDKWINQNHFLSKSGGSWKIVGGASHWLEEITVLPGGAVDYQLEFHPLF
jgi:ketosteroid isomerase-like protein